MRSRAQDAPGGRHARSDSKADHGPRDGHGAGRWGYFIPTRFAGRAPRPGTGAPYAAIEAILGDRKDRFQRVLDGLERFAAQFEAIGAQQPPAPRWRQGWFPRLDAAVAYAMVRDRAPARIVEVGSGHSTRFLARGVSRRGSGYPSQRHRSAPAGLPGGPRRRSRGGDGSRGGFDAVRGPRPRRLRDGGFQPRPGPGQRRGHDHQPRPADASNRRRRPFPRRLSARRLPWRMGLAGLQRTTGHSTPDPRARATRSCSRAVSSRRAWRTLSSARPRAAWRSFLGRWNRACGWKNGPVSARRGGTSRIPQPVAQAAEPSAVTTTRRAERSTGISSA